MPGLTFFPGKHQIGIIALQGGGGGGGGQILGLLLCNRS